MSRNFYGGNEIIVPTTGNTGSGVIGGRNAGSIRKPGRSSQGNGYSGNRPGNSRSNQKMGSLSDTIQDIWNVISDGVTGAASGGPDAWKKAYDAIKDGSAGGIIGDAAKDLYDKLVDGSKGAAGGAKDLLENPDLLQRRSGGYGGGSGGSAKDYDWYLQQVHNEQERVWMREDTKHQREVADLQAAGLNPVLSATSGMASGGSSSSDSAAVSHISDLAAMAVSGLSSTASGLATAAGLGGFGSWWSKNGKTVQSVVSTAKALAGIVKMIIPA